MQLHFINYLGVPLLCTPTSYTQSGRVIRTNLLRTALTHAAKVFPLLPLTHGLSFNSRPVILTRDTSCLIMPRGYKKKPHSIEVMPNGIEMMPHGIKMMPHGIEMKMQRKMNLPIGLQQ